MCVYIEMKNSNIFLKNIHRNFKEGDVPYIIKLYKLLDKYFAPYL